MTKPLRETIRGTEQVAQDLASSMAFHVEGWSSLLDWLMLRKVFSNLYPVETVKNQNQSQQK